MVLLAIWEDKTLSLLTSDSDIRQEQHYNGLLLTHLLLESVYGRRTSSRESYCAPVIPGTRKVSNSKK